MTSLLCWRTPFSRSTTSPRKCCHSNSKGSALKLLPFNKFLYICRKSHQIWLNYLSLSLSYGQNTSEHPLGRMGQAFQNAERNRWQRPTGLTHRPDPPHPRKFAFLDRVAACFFSNHLRDAQLFCLSVLVLH